MSSIDIGIVNNMPDAALRATEHQFISLISAAAGSTRVRLQFYALPGVPRSKWALSRSPSYKSVADLWDDSLDGLIVTGTEPRAADLRNEPYWPDMERLIVWADYNTTSSVWSCLAAHAAVLHIDNIQRRRLQRKRFGVFDSTIAFDHALTRTVTTEFRMPHSRWNDLSEQELFESGYSTLMRSASGVDAFIKKRRSLFVFFQGHPEYEADTLMLEYRRDIRKFLSGETETYPDLPHGYFDAETLAALTAFRQRASDCRSESLISNLPLVGSMVTNTWLPGAVQIYRNWLTFLAEQKNVRRPSLVAAQHGL